MVAYTCSSYPNLKARASKVCMNAYNIYKCLCTLAVCTCIPCILQVQNVNPTSMRGYEADIGYSVKLQSLTCCTVMIDMVFQSMRGNILQTNENNDFSKKLQPFSFSLSFKVSIGTIDEPIAGVSNGNK